MIIIMHIIGLCSEQGAYAACQMSWSAGRVVVIHSEPIASALKAFSYASCKAAQKSEHFAFIINVCFLICMS